MTLAHLEEVVGRISFRDWTLLVAEETDAFTIQWVFEAEDIETGVVETQKARKWRVSRWSTDSEVVQTALLAAFVATEHEVREMFTYRGAKVFGPHMDVESRVAIANDLEVRA